MVWSWLPPSPMRIPPVSAAKVRPRLKPAKAHLWASLAQQVDRLMTATPYRVFLRVSWALGKHRNEVLFSQLTPSVARKFRKKIREMAQL